MAFRPASLALVAIALLAVSHSAFAIERRSVIIIDATNRQVLYSEAPDAARYPASLTKMMTLYLTFDALDKGKLKLDQRLPVSRHAATQAPSSLGLHVGETISVEQAILGITTKSANDAAVTLSEAIGGNEKSFADMMTNRARALGMTGTVFRNASGLPNRQQHTTARDMATLALALWANHRNYYHYFSAREFTFDGHTHINHNHMLTNYDGADGIKTGYINDSGFNLVASAKRDGRRLIGVVFGGTSVSARDHEMSRLLDAGFTRAVPAPETDMRVAGSADPGQAARAASSMVAAFNPVPVAQAAEPDIGTEQGSTHADRDTWALQVGAFSKQVAAERQAQKAMKSIPALLQLDGVSVEASPDGTGKLYRARVTGLSEQEARDACRQLHRKKMHCLPIAPN
ncbi:MAG TPA: D-alanyl-D-alanine carboxypeptidase [Candidatus Cybelea sp.]|nr:D-alanyl-D-alanine carboxypeptidase [Candidatus Cybelea sp.]